MAAANTIGMKWNAGLYDSQHDFVFKYGEDLVKLLAPKTGERILDLGCGTGHLTNLIAESGADVIGIDNSPDMISKARAEFPALTFEVLPATDFHFTEPFDAVFSNAVIHWVAEKEKLIQCVAKHLKVNGRMVVEFGGKDNVKSIVHALRQVLLQYGFAENARRQVWYFPSLGEYTSLLEQYDLVVNYAVYYNRETELKDTDNGITEWIRMFGSSYLKGIDERVLNTLLSEVQDILRPTNYRNNKWYADYKRLRIVATKVKSSNK